MSGESSSDKCVNCAGRSGQNPLLYFGSSVAKLASNRRVTKWRTSETFATSREDVVILARISWLDVVMKSVLVAIVLALTSVPPVLAAQAQESASIEGIVIRLGSGQPVARARVALDGLGSNSDPVTSTRRSPGPGQGAGAKLAGSLLIEVGSGDTAGVTISLRPGFNVAGRIMVEGRGHAAADAAVSNATIGLQSRASQLSIGAAKVALDGTFVLNGVAPGEYKLQVSGLPPHVYVKLAQLPGADLLSGPVRIEAEPQGLLDIIVSPGAGTLDATVVNERREPAFRVPVVVVPDPPLRERVDLYRTASIDESGQVRYVRLAPGSYKVFAWEDVEPGAWLDPSFLGSYERLATEVCIGERANESAVVTLLPQR
jgi:hypothetical protein